MLANIVQVTPAANTLEDTQMIGYTSKDAISNFSHDQHFNKKVKFLIEYAMNWR